MRAAFYRQRLLLLALGILAFVVVPVAFTQGVSVAGLVLGILLLSLAFFRLVLPVDALGALVVRRRGIDVLILVALGVGIIVLSGTPNL